MSKYPHVAYRMDRDSEGPGQHLSPVTFLLFLCTKPIQLLHPDPSSSGLSLICDSQQLWPHCIAQLSCTAQQKNQSNTMIHILHRHFGLKIFTETSPSVMDTIQKQPLTLLQTDHRMLWVESNLKEP